MLENISTGELFEVCSTLEAAHEPDDIAVAKQKLSDWGINLHDAMDELLAREEMIKKHKDEITIKNDGMPILERICRLICEAENVNPDMESKGCGGVIERDKPYKLWQARIRVGQLLLDSGLSFKNS